MKRSQAARFARWSAWVAFLLAGSTGAVYLKRQIIAHVEKRNAPPAAPREVERQSSGLTFSKVEGTRTIFTVQASKSTDFRGQDTSLLENVVFTSFGKNGDRHDIMHTQSCQYAKADGSIQCNGDVLMELQSAADAERSRVAGGPPIGLVRVETRAVTFEKATGTAQTVEPVKFSFPNGTGNGIGAVYFSEQGGLRLVREVHLKIYGNPTVGAKQKEGPPTEVAIDGSSLEFGKHTRRVVMSGPVTATTQMDVLKSGELTMLLDDKFRAEALIATPGLLKETPVVTSRDPSGNSNLTADRLAAHLEPGGWLTTLLAEGHLHAQTDHGEVRSETGEMLMWPRTNEPKQLVVRGNVHVDTRDAKTGSTRSLETQALQITYTDVHPGEPQKMKHAETLTRGSMQWSAPTGVHSTVNADKLSVEFNAIGKAQQLAATGGFQSNREIPGQPVQLLMGLRGVVQLSPNGEWAHMNVNGDVHYKQGERSAESNEAVATREPEVVVLMGNAAVRDATSETHAAKISFRQASSDVEAEGSVRTTDFGGTSSPVEFAAVPANLSSDHLRANTNSGRALYTGHVRLWQGPSVLEADSIELLRTARVLNALGSVRGVFQQVPSDTDSKRAATLWHVSSKALTYWDSENRAHLEKDVVVQSPDQRMRSAALELYFTRVPDAAGSGGSSAQIHRAVGTGGVVVEEGLRRATAEQGVYTAEDQKFVLTGGNPTIYDSSEGTTTGRELTFYIADDTIIVDSETGKRTLSKHRVQR